MQNNNNIIKIWLKIKIKILAERTNNFRVKRLQKVKFNSIKIEQKELTCNQMFMNLNNSNNTKLSYQQLILILFRVTIFIAKLRTWKIFIKINSKIQNKKSKI